MDAFQFRPQALVAAADPSGQKSGGGRPYAASRPLQIQMQCLPLPGCWVALVAGEIRTSHRPHAARCIVEQLRPAAQPQTRFAKRDSFSELAAKRQPNSNTQLPANHARPGRSWTAGSPLAVSSSI